MEIVGLAANSNAEKLAAAANITRPKAICLVDERKIDLLRTRLKYEPKIFAGQNGLREIARLEDADMFLIAIVGTRDCIQRWTQLNRAKIWRREQRDPGDGGRSGHGGGSKTRRENSAGRFRAQRDLPVPGWRASEVRRLF